MINLVNEPIDTWEVVLKKEGVLIYKTYKPGNAAVFVKGHCDIPDVDKETLYQAIYNLDLRTKWDKLLENFYVVEK